MTFLTITKQSQSKSQNGQHCVFQELNGGSPDAAFSVVLKYNHSVFLRNDRGALSKMT